MYSVISRPIPPSSADTFFNISADTRIVPSGFRNSCANPAVNWPNAANRSDRRTAASAFTNSSFARANSFAVSWLFRASKRLASAS